MKKVLFLLLDVEREEALGETAYGIGNGGENWGDLRTELAQNLEGSPLMRKTRGNRILLR